MKKAICIMAVVLAVGLGLSIWIWIELARTERFLEECNDAHRRMDERSGESNALLRRIHDEANAEATKSPWWGL